MPLVSGGAHRDNFHPWDRLCLLFCACGKDCSGGSTSTGRAGRQGLCYECATVCLPSGKGERTVKPLVEKDLPLDILIRSKLTHGWNPAVLPIFSNNYSVTIVTLKSNCANVTYPCMLSSQKRLVERALSALDKLSWSDLPCMNRSRKTPTLVLFWSCGIRSVFLSG